MIIIGVTGKSGSGKSTVSTIIKNNSGAIVIDADLLVKEMSVPGEKYYDEIVKMFGEGILIKTPEKHKGRIDKNKLAKTIFEDSDKREKLNKLTFKYVGAETKKIILENKDKEIVVLDFPLLYEGGFDKICNCVIGVIADEETMVARIKERDRLPKEQIQKRIDIQINEDDLKAKADYIVDNSAKVKYIGLVKDMVKLIHKIKKDEEEKK